MHLFKLVGIILFFGCLGFGIYWLIGAAVAQSVETKHWLLPLIGIVVGAGLWIKYRHH